MIVGAGDRLRAVPIADLLPESYVWADHQTEPEAAEDTESAEGVGGAAPLDPS